MIFPPLVFTDNVPSDAVFDVEFYNPLGNSTAQLNQITCNFRIGTSSASPTVTISASKGAGGVTIALAQSVNSANFVGDSGQVSLVIPVNNSIWARFTNCNLLGDGQFNLIGQPAVVSVTGLAASDLMTMLKIAFGKEMTPFEIAYVISSARRFIQNRGNFRCMESNGTVTITQAIGSGPYAFSTYGIANLKNIISIYINITASGTTPQQYVPIYIERDRSKFNRYRLSSYPGLPPPYCNSGTFGYPMVVNIFEDNFYFTPFTQDNVPVTVEYYGYLSNITGASTDGLYQDFPETIECYAQAQAERLKPTGDMKKALALEELAQAKLKVEMHGDTEIRSGDENSETIKPNSRWGRYNAVRR